MSSALVSAVVSCGVAELSSPRSWSRETTCWGFRGRDSILVTLVSHTQIVSLAQVAGEGTAGSRAGEGCSRRKTQYEVWKGSLWEMKLKSDGQGT